MAGLIFEFFCELRGYHVYKNEWIPTVNEQLSFEPEPNNCFDRYAIAAVKYLRNDTRVVGHLPKEVSRLVTFILAHGAEVSVKVMDNNHRRSPLIQGGLEIPILVIIKMSHSEKNQAKLAKLEELINKYYKEPVDGKFEDATEFILQSIRGQDSSEDDYESDED